MSFNLHNYATLDIIQYVQLPLALVINCILTQALKMQIEYLDTHTVFQKLVGKVTKMSLHVETYFQQNYP